MTDQSDSPNIIHQPGDYNLETVNIISYRKNDEEGTLYEYNIKPIVVTIELTEDIFSGFMSGNIIVKDAQDIRSVLPITGLEKLELAFNTPGMTGVRALRDEGHPFHIYKIEGVQVDPTNPRAQFYNLYFCSKEMFYNSFNRMSQAYAGPIEYGVEKILRDVNGLNSKKPFLYEPTKTNTKFVIPNLKPINAINLMGQSAISGLYNNAGYLFYETPQGFNFRSVESMLALGGASARPAAFKYQYQITNTQDEDVEIDMKNVIRYHFERPVNTLYNLNEGMIASKLIAHDSFYKTIQETDFDYLESFGKYFHTEHDNGAKTTINGTLPLSKFDGNQYYLSEKSNAKLMTTTNTSKTHNDYEIVPVDQTIQNKLSQRLQMRNVNLNLQVYGNSLINAGAVIYFEMPYLRPLGEKDNTDENPYWSGRYLIMAVKHIISRDDERYEMSLKCMKDAVQTPYDVETDNVSVNERTYNQSVQSVYQADQSYLNDIDIDE
jgi:hypothetical protein